MRSERRELWTAGALIAFAVGLLFRGLLRGEVLASNDVGTSDLLYLYLPLETLYGEALKRGELLQWTPHIYSGHPVLAEGFAGFLYLPTALFFGVLSPVGAMKLFLLFHAALLGMGVFLFARQLTRSAVAAIPAGVAASICGSVTVGQARRMTGYATVALMPLLFLSAESFARRGRLRDAAGFGAVLGLMLLAGFPQLAFVGGFLAAVYLVARRIFSTTGDAKPAPLRIAAFFGIAAVLAGLTALPQLRATLELTPFSNRAGELTRSFTGMGSLPFLGFLTFVAPYWRGDIGNDTFALPEVYDFWETFFYSGALTFGLAAWGALRFRRDPAVRALLVMALCSYVLALGENLPVYRVFSVVPLVRSFRFQARWFVGAELAVLALCGFGVRALVERLSTRRLLVASAIAVALTLEIFLVAGRQLRTAPAEQLIGLDAADAASLKGGRQLTLGAAETFVAAFEQAHGWEGDLSAYAPAVKLLPPNLAAMHGLSQVNGYGALVPRYVYEIWGDLNHPGTAGRAAKLQDGTLHVTPSFARLCRLWGVRRVSSPWVLPEPFKVLDELRYELPDPLPRSWIVDHVQPAPVEGAVGEALVADGFDPERTALVSGELPALPPDSAQGLALFRKEEDQSLELEASSPGLLVVSDTWFPRWRATVDGKPSPVLRVNGSMRGVVVNRPHAVVRFEYDDGHVKLWTALGYALLLGCAAVALRQERR